MPASRAADAQIAFDNTQLKYLSIDISDPGIVAQLTPKRWYGLSFAAPAAPLYLSSVSVALFHNDPTYQGPQAVSVVLALHRMTNNTVSRRPLYRKAAIGTFDEVRGGAEPNAPFSYFTFNLYVAGILLDPAVASTYMLVIYPETNRFPMQLRATTSGTAQPFEGVSLPTGSYLRSAAGTWIRRGSNALQPAMLVRRGGEQRAPGASQWISRSHFPPPPPYACRWPTRATTTRRTSSTTAPRTSS